jgi:redox-sensitive bicupin YhaK (pirin superfamily)
VITLARAETRRHSVGGTQSSWRTFHRRGPSSPLAGGFGRLELLDEFRLSAGASIPDHARREGETITFVHEGALAYRNSLGHSAVLQAGEFQLRTVSDGLRSVEENASPADSVHFFRISLRPSQVGLEPSQAQRRFGTADRRGGLCVIASRDGRKGSLSLRQDTVIHSALLEPGQHVAYELGAGRGAWLHLVEGEANLNGITLITGDGAGIRAERAVSFTAAVNTEILLIDLSE